jgi:hypothetical protein
MKKTLYLFGATLMATAILSSCSKKEEAPRNYFGNGVQSTDAQGTPKEAYYAFFGGLVVTIVLVLWFLKKMGNKK